MPSPLTDGMRRRIDAVPTRFHVRRLELFRELPDNPCGVEVRRFSETVAATAAAALPHVDWMQHVAGLAPGDETLVPEIVAWFEELGLRPRFEIAPAPDFEALAAALTAVGARQTGFIDTLWGPAVEPADDPPEEVDVHVVAAGSEEAPLFARVHLAGHEVPEDVSSDHWTAVERWIGEPGWRCYLAAVDGQPVAAAALAIDEGVGYLASASTVPSGRRRHCQQALIHHRLRDAAAGACELVVSLATPGTTSHRNLERGGLGVAYTNVFWTVT